MVDPLVVIVGPTAVGKTALSLRLAQAIDAEIVNVDSRQMYRCMDIGTAKPTPSEQAEVPHHLLDVLLPDQSSNAAQCADLARQAIDDVRRRGRRAVIVSGSGLYLQALLYGLMPVPSAMGSCVLNCPPTPVVMEMPRCTPCCNRPIQSRRPPATWHDRVRVVRALEVTYLTGVPFSEHRSRHRTHGPLYPHMGIALTRDRAELYARIGERTDAMLAAGWLAEAEMLVAHGYTETCAAMNSLGYRELLGYLAGRTAWQETVDAIKQATRRFAKRQLTWFSKLPNLSWYNFTRVDESAVVAKVVDTLRNGMDMQVEARSL